MSYEHIDLRYTWCFYDDFFGGGTLTTAGQYDPWVITDTSSAGTPTYVRVDLGESTVAGALGSAKLTHDNTNEIQNVCLSFGDKLAFDINKVRGFECRVKMGQAALNAATSVAFGLTGDRNDAIDSIAYQMLFRVIGGDDTTAVVVESDDASANNDDIATSTTLINAWKVFKIVIPAGLASVTYWIDEARVASGTTFSMANYDAGLQPFFQIQKSAATSTDALEIDYVKVWGVR